jgi:hypothetical protein
MSKGELLGTSLRSPTTATKDGELEFPYFFTLKFHCRTSSGRAWGRSQFFKRRQGMGRMVTRCDRIRPSLGQFTKLEACASNLPADIQPLE